MPSTFHPRLINDPFGDPGLFVACRFQKRALLFDLGDLHPLAPRDLLKISHVFVTHAHMDHFIGFDALLRICLGRSKRLHLFGPGGILGHVEGKLAGYAWNLVANYREAFVLTVTEIDAGRRTTRCYRCASGFRAEPLEGDAPCDGRVHVEPQLEVQAAPLDHGLPCLAFALRERMRVNLRPEALEALGIRPGPWLQAFKEAIYRREDPQAPIALSPAGTGPGAERRPLGEWMARVARLGPGQKLAYVTDAAWTRDNVARILDLARGADQLFIEAAFLERDRELAERKGHLTAHQAGSLAARAGARRVEVFHHSPRYAGMADALAAEARRAFDTTAAETLPRERSANAHPESRP